MKFLITLLALIPFSLSAELIDCNKGIGEFGNLGNMRYQIGYFASSGKCFISVGPRNSYPLYRSYSFDSKGELMVFNSLGDGRPSTDTGARNYQFPVVSSSLQYELDSEDSYIRVKMTDGRLWVFDAKSSKIESISDTRFFEDPVVNRSNRGGLELTPLTGQIIDEGWRVGGPPNIVMKRKSVVKDANRGECQVSNEKLFKHILDNRGRVDGAYFIHDTASKWKGFIKRECGF